MKFSKPFFVTLMLVSISIHAEVVIDGTLGPRVELSGPDYQIKAELGQQHGPNLFHSFQYFNLQSLETATFSGPNSVHNIISRVTGNNPSHIDGTIRSAIGGADVYLLNPSGILFGPNAKLDVQGSFHASTANYLRLRDGGRFDANQPNSSLLTVAPVEAFGFLGNTVAPISVEGLGEINEDQWDGHTTGLIVPDGETLSFIGGDIEIKKGTFLKTVTVFDDGWEWIDVAPLGSLSAPQGRINLISVASKGEAIPTTSGIDLSTFQKLGELLVGDKSLVDVSGTGGGSIFIRGERFFARDSRLHAQTLADQDGGLIDIQADSVFLADGTQISGNTQGTGRGSDIRIQAADSITVSGENDEGVQTAIYSQSGNWLVMDEELGDAGQIVLKTKKISFKEGALISVDTYGTGQGGDVTLKATESVTFSGENSLGSSSQILAITFGTAEEAGDAGTLLIEANNIAFDNGSGIFSHTAGKGQGGTIILRAKELIRFTGLTTGGYGSILESNVLEDSNGGDAGKIFIETQDLLLTDGANIISPAFGSGQGGDISISATGTVTISGTDENGWNSGIGSSSNPKFIQNEEGLLIPVTAGQGGNITLEVNQLVLTQGGSIASSSIAPEGLKGSQAGQIRIKADSIEIIGVNPHGETEDGFGSGIYVNSKGVEKSAGDAGEIFLETNSLVIKQGGVISSGTTGHAQGGRVEIRVNGTLQIAGDSSKLSLTEPAEAQLLYQENFEDYASRDSISGIYASSSGTTDGAGNAGEIVIYSKNIGVTDGGIINTSTQNAGGGHITITTPNILYLRDGQITTSVQGGKGRGGDITLSDPVFVISAQGLIKAQADEGRGGDIYIKSGRFITSPDSIVSASSRLGIDGKVEIESPIVSLDDFLVQLPGSYLGEVQLPKGCEDIQDVNELSTFHVQRVREGISITPENFQE